MLQDWQEIREKRRRTRYNERREGHQAVAKCVRFRYRSNEFEFSRTPRSRRQVVAGAHGEAIRQQISDAKNEHNTS